MYQFEIGNKSVNSILNAAMSLYWKHGIRRVSVEEICSEAGISKMTFYRNFKNKQDVALQVIKLTGEKSMERYKHIMNSESPFRTKVEQLIQFKEKESQNISTELIKDIYSGNSTELAAYIQQQQAILLKTIKEDFTKAQKKGELRSDISIDFIIYKLNKIQHELLDDELNKIYPRKDELIMALTNSFFYGIMNGNK